MKLIFAMCLVPFVACTAETRESALGWSNLISEGKALTRAGNYSEAAQAFGRALAIAEDSDLGNRRLIGIYGALASVDAEAGQYAESEHEYQRALDLTEKILGRQSLEYALLVARMAMLPTQIGNRDSEIALLREAIVVNRPTGSVRELTIVRICPAQILMDEGDTRKRSLCFWMASQFCRPENNEPGTAGRNLERPRRASS
jgi:tetratricopeptide (TPR) repeat protein